MKTPYTTNPPRALDGRPLPVVKDYGRGDDTRVAPTSEHKKAITENMQKEFDKARGLPPTPNATQDIYYPPGTEPRKTDEFLAAAYRALTAALLVGHNLKRGEVKGEYELKNGMIVAETESWRKNGKKVYRIFKNDEDEQGIFATADLDVLVVKLWELGAL